MIYSDSLKVPIENVTVLLLCATSEHMHTRKYEDKHLIA